MFSDKGKQHEELLAEFNIMFCVRCEKPAKPHLASVVGYGQISFILRGKIQKVLTLYS